MNAGGICIGCTMPGFPDKFAPFYQSPPGSYVSGHTARLVGSFIRPLRRITQRDRNREVLWDKTGLVTSGWGAAPHPTFLDRVMDLAYNGLRRKGSAAKHI